MKKIIKNTKVLVLGGVVALTLTVGVTTAVKSRAIGTWGFNSKEVAGIGSWGNN